VQLHFRGVNQPLGSPPFPSLLPFPLLPNPSPPSPFLRSRAFPPSFPFSLSPSLPSPSLSPPLEVGPLKSSYEVWGSFPSGVWGGAPAKIKFGAFRP